MTTTATNVDAHAVTAPAPALGDFESFNTASTERGAGGGSAAADWFQMLGVSTATLDAIYWKVSGSSDFAAASAPEPVTDITLVRSWTV